MRKIWNYYRKLAEIAPITTQNKGSCREGVRKGWCRVRSPAYLWNRGAGMGRNFPEIKLD